MFSDKQNEALRAPLSSAHVKTRTQAGRTLSYLESWRVIDEANRIFGFDGWTSETIEIRCVSERERAIGSQQRPGWGVSYIAKVRITVFADDTLVIREGVGAGHGIDVDLGQAHESAIKESESDARKRALMSFGNSFGLALYDKEQANVEKITCGNGNGVVPKAAPTSPLLSEPNASEAATRLCEEISAFDNYAALDTFIRSDNFKYRVGALPDKHRGKVRLTYKTKGDQLKGAGDV